MLLRGLAPLVALPLLLVNDCSNPEGELDAARARWNAAGIESYDISGSVSCECIPLGVWTLHVRDGVRAGVTVDSTAVSDFLDLEELVSHSTAQSKSVAELFELAERGIQEGERHHLEFDEALGYPTRVFVDWILGVADEETSYRIVDLAPVSGER